MALQGDLKNMPLPDILQSLMLNRQTGLLTLRDGTKEIFIFFNEERITHVNPGKPSQEYLAPILAANAGITLEKMDQELKKRGKRSIAEQLAKAKLIEAAAVHEIHRRYLTEFLYDAFAWKKGTFVFEPCEAPHEQFDEDQRGVELELPIEQLTLESMQRIDEWKLIRRLIPTMDEILVVSDQFASQIVKITEPSRTVVSLCDGRNSVADIAYTLGYDLFTVAKILAEYAKTHHIRRVKSEDLVLRAEQLLEQADKQGAVKYLKKAVELDQANMEIRSRYADICTELGMRTEAANEYKVLAQQARESEQFDTAKEFYRKVISINPKEHQIQKRLFEMLRMKGDPDTCKEGFVLAAILDQLGMLAEEVEVLRRIIEIDPATIAIRERTGDIEASLGNGNAAIECYEAAAGLCLKQGDQRRACGLYEKVLDGSPGDAKVSAKIAELKNGLYLANKERRKRAVRVAVFAAADALLLFIAGYQGVSLAGYFSMRNDNLVPLTAGDFDAACANAAQWTHRFPLSFARLDARRYVRAMRGLQPTVAAPAARSAPPPTPAVPAAEDSSIVAPALPPAPDSTAAAPDSIKAKSASL